MSTKKISSLDEALIDEVYSITRNVAMHDSERLRLLAQFVSKNNLELKILIPEIIHRDRTGWKEVVGKIAKLTGYGFEELGILPNDIKRLNLKSFGPVGSVECMATVWEELCKKIRNEVAEANERSARINFSTELNSVSVSASH